MNHCNQFIDNRFVSTIEAMSYSSLDSMIENVANVSTPTNSTRFFKNNDGCDGRFPTESNKSADADIVLNITGFLRKMKMLYILEDASISDNEKLKQIDASDLFDDVSKYVYNLEKGGLYKDWNMTI
jgi:hypothetical protein